MLAVHSPGRRGNFCWAEHAREARKSVKRARVFGEVIFTGPFRLRLRF
jgi:hypothetical protein